MAKNNYLSEKEIYQREKSILNRYENEKLLVEDTNSIDKIVVISPEQEITMLDFYSIMPEISIDPDIKNLLNNLSNNKKSLSDEMKDNNNSYMNEFSRLQQYEKNLEDKLREPHKEEVKRAKKQIRQANFDNLAKWKDLKKAKKDALKEETMVKGWKKIHSARKSYKSSKKALKDAKKNLKELKGRYSQTVGTIRVNIKLQHEKLDKIRNEKMEKTKSKAFVLKQYLESVHGSLQKQYRIVNQYRAIQLIKNNNGIRTHLQAKNKYLLATIDSFPELDKGSLVISLKNPINSFPQEVNQERLTEINKEIQKISQKLPNGVFKDGKLDEVSLGKMKTDSEKKLESLEQFNKDIETDANHTLEELNEKLKNASDESEKEQIQNKIDYLNLKIKIKAQQMNIKELIISIRNSSNPSQASLQELHARQENLKLNEEALEKNPCYIEMQDLKSQFEIYDEALKKLPDLLSQRFNLQNTKLSFDTIIPELGIETIQNPDGTYSSVLEVATKMSLVSLKTYLKDHLNTRNLIPLPEEIGDEQK